MSEKPGNYVAQQIASGAWSKSDTPDAAKPLFSNARHLLKHSGGCLHDYEAGVCTCGARPVRSNDIDPPEPQRDRRCTIHGDRRWSDPDGARDERQDKAHD